LDHIVSWVVSSREKKRIEQEALMMTGCERKGRLGIRMTKVRPYHDDSDDLKEGALSDWSSHDVPPRCAGGMSLWIMPRLQRELKREGKGILFSNTDERRKK
jgi:hypothetical protein